MSGATIGSEIILDRRAVVHQPRNDSVGVLLLELRPAKDIISRTCSTDRGAHFRSDIRICDPLLEVLK